jgi:hypothetical protein
MEHKSANQFNPVQHGWTALQQVLLLGGSSAVLNPQPRQA